MTIIPLLTVHRMGAIVFQMITNVVFDLGNVLVECNPRNLYRKIFDVESEMETFLSTICTQAWNEEQDAGRPFARGVAELVTKYPDFAKEIQLFDSRWAEMLGAPIWSVVEILERLKARGLKLYALSNWSAEKFPHAQERCPFFSSFDGMVISGHIGLKKPDPRIYNHLCEKFSIEPSQSVFIDDFRVNVEAAARLGFQSIHFTDPAGVESQLIKLNVLT